MKAGPESNWKVGASRIFPGPWPTALSQVINFLKAPRHLDVFKRKQTVYLDFHALNISAFVKEDPWGGFVVRWHLSTLQSWGGLAKDVFTGSSGGGPRGESGGFYAVIEFYRIQESGVHGSVGQGRPVFLWSSNGPLRQEAVWTCCPF